ncbi:hypothetical protein HY968_00540 [Candidatus Kaiserbacteria bacterium]|nr:hypothetical protein [Candidatus Kaiserbacteria bacterium]
MVDFEKLERHVSVNDDENAIASLASSIAGPKSTYEIRDTAERALRGHVTNVVRHIANAPFTDELKVNIKILGDIAARGGPAAKKEYAELNAILKTESDLARRAMEFLQRHSGLSRAAQAKRREQLKKDAPGIV